MTSEIRANTLKNRVGLGTVSFTNTGAIVSGIVTANSFSGPTSGTTGTFSGNVDIGGDLDVDGHTNLDNVIVAGVSTHNDHIHLIDNKRLRLGTAANGDAVLLHNGSDTVLDNQTGNLFFRSASTHLQSLSGDDKIVAEANGVVELYHSGSKKLETKSTGVLISNQGNNRILDVHHTNGTSAYVAFLDQNTTDNAAVRVGAEGNDFKIFAGSYERLRIDSSGRLLVGTNTNNAHANADNAVISGTGNIGLSIMSTDSGRSSIYFGDSSSSPGSYAGFIDFIHSSNSFIIGRGNDTSLTIDSSGRLLVGTSAGWGSNVKLHLASSTNTYLTITSGTSHNGVLAFSDDGTERGSIDYDHNGDTLNFRANGIKRATVGATYFYVDDGTNGRVTLQPETANVNQILSTTTGFGSYCNLKYQAADHIFLYGGTERLRITSDGNITFGITSGGSSASTSTQIKTFDLGRDYWNSTKGDYRAVRLKVFNMGLDDVYGIGISSNTLEIQAQHSIGFFTGSAGTGTGRRNLRGTLDNNGFFRFTNGVKLGIDAAHSFSSGVHALINLGSDQGTNTETRAIDMHGSWGTGENKSISFTHGTIANNLVGQINSIHHSPGSSLRWGKLYHGGDSTTYTMTLDSTSSTTADLNLQGRFRSSKHPAFSVSASGGQSNLGTSATKIQYTTHGTHGYLYDGFDTTNNRFVAPVDGVYTFYVRHWFVPSHTGSLQLLLYRNGSQIKESRFSVGSANPEYNTVQLTSTIFLSATNYIEVYGVTYSGSSTNVFHVSSGSFHTEFSGYLVC